MLLLLAAAPAPAQDDARPIIDRAFEAAKENEARTRDYVYHERIEEKRFDRRGREKKHGSKTWDVTQFEDSDYRRLIAIDDRPLDARGEARERARLDRHLAKVRNEAPRQRARRLARVEKERREGEELLEEITRAFDFRLVGEEKIDGIPTWEITAEPRAGYRPRGRMARALPKVRATLWVSRRDHAWVRAEIETIGDITFTIYRLREGARIRFRQRQLDDGVWVTERWDVKLLARIALVYRLEAELSGTYDNFRRFSTDTTVTGWARADGPG